MIPSRTDNESEVDQHRVVVQISRPGSQLFGPPTPLPVPDDEHLNYLPVEEFLFALLIKGLQRPRARLRHLNTQAELSVSELKSCLH